MKIYLVKQYGPMRKEAAEMVMKMSVLSFSEMARKCERKYSRRSEMKARRLGYENENAEKHHQV